jgi:hypothetical protein
MSTIATVLGGLRQSENLLARTASQLAQSPLPAGAGQDQVSLSDKAVALLDAKSSYEANLGSIKVAEEMPQSTMSLVG